MSEEGVVLREARRLAERTQLCQEGQNRRNRPGCECSGCALRGVLGARTPGEVYRGVDGVLESANDGMTREWLRADAWCDLAKALAEAVRRLDEFESRDDDFINLITDVREIREEMTRIRREIEEVDDDDTWDDDEEGQWSQLDAQIRAEADHSMPRDEPENPPDGEDFFP